jgi:hypothetical protein
MRIDQLALVTAVAVLGLAVRAHAAPVITPLGNYNLLPNTPGQKISLYVTGIVPIVSPALPVVPDGVRGMVLNVAINDGGPAWGPGLPGPGITKIDVDTGPTIWVPPSTLGHQPPAEYYDGQLASSGFLVNNVASAYVNVTSGLLATLEIDTSGFFSGTFSLTLSGGTLADTLGSTQIIGGFGDAGFFYVDVAPGQITIVPEPSSMVLAVIGSIGLAAWRWRRKPCASPISRTASG